MQILLLPRIKLRLSDSSWLLPSHLIVTTGGHLRRLLLGRRVKQTSQGGFILHLTLLRCVLIVIIFINVCYATYMISYSPTIGWMIGSSRGLSTSTMESEEYLPCGVSTSVIAFFTLLHIVFAKVGTVLWWWSRWVGVVDQVDKLALKGREKWNL